MALTSGLVQTAFVGPDGKIQEPWRIYLRNQELTVAKSATNTTTPVQLPPASASIGTTPFSTESLSEGLYRATYYARISSADGTSSSLTVSFSWTDGTVTCSTAFAAITGDTTSTTGSGTYLMNIDGGSPVSYATVYASNTPGLMKYDLSLVLEQIGQ